MLRPAQGDDGPRPRARPRGVGRVRSKWDICQGGEEGRGEGTGGIQGDRAFRPRGDKGRYVLPPAFRNAIAPTAKDPRTLCLVKHDRWNCLTGFDMARTETFDRGWADHNDFEWPIPAPQTRQANGLEIGF